MLGDLNSGRLKDHELAAHIIPGDIKQCPMLDAGRHTLSSSLSLWDTSVGNLPALFRPGPRRRGICLITASEARKAAYFLAIRQENIVRGQAITNISKAVQELAQPASLFWSMRA